MEHLADKFDGRRLIRVLLFELHYQPKCSIFEGGVSGTDDYGIPASLSLDVVHIRRVMFVNLESIPSHDIVGYGRGRNAGRRVGLHALHEDNSQH